MEDIHVNYEESTKNFKSGPGRVTVHYADDCVVIMNDPPHRPAEHAILPIEVFDQIVDRVNQQKGVDSITKTINKRVFEFDFDIMELIFGVVVVLALISFLAEMIQQMQ